MVENCRLLIDPFLKSIVDKGPHQGCVGRYRSLTEWKDGGLELSSDRPQVFKAVPHTIGCNLLAIGQNLTTYGPGATCLKNA